MSSDYGYIMEPDYAAMACVECPWCGIEYSVHYRFRCPLDAILAWWWDADGTRRKLQLADAKDVRKPRALVRILWQRYAGRASAILERLARLWNRRPHPSVDSDLPF